MPAVLRAVACGWGVRVAGVPVVEVGAEGLVSELRDAIAQAIWEGLEQWFVENVRVAWPDAADDARSVTFLAAYAVLGLVEERISSERARALSDAQAAIEALPLYNGTGALGVAEAHGHRQERLAALAVVRRLAEEEQ
jgi:hypothetical protein